MFLRWNGLDLHRHGTTTLRGDSLRAPTSSWCAGGRVLLNAACPYCAMPLADMGAEVVKREPRSRPGSAVRGGNRRRQSPAFHAGFSGKFRADAIALCVRLTSPPKTIFQCWFRPRGRHRSTALQADALAPLDLHAKLQAFQPVQAIDPLLADLQTAPTASVTSKAPSCAISRAYCWNWAPDSPSLPGRSRQRLSEASELRAEDEVIPEAGAVRQVQAPAGLNPPRLPVRAGRHGETFSQ